MPAPQSAPSAESRAYPRRWLAMFVLLLAAFMNLIDVTIVNVALPRLQESLGATSTEIEWVVAAYVLAFALGLLPFGRLGDTIGRKRMFQTGVVLFTLFSAVCGLAPTMQTLIIARVFQGLAGAMMMPQVLAIAQVMFPPQERGAAFSLFGLTAGLASVAGPLTGGLLIGADIFGLDWRPIFLVNIPLGVITVAATAMLVPQTPANPALKHDVGGILLAALTVFLLVFPLIEGHSLGWPMWTFAMLGLAVVSAIAFQRHEAGRARAGLSQLLPVTLLHNRSFLLGMTMVTVFFSGVAGFFIVLAVFLQTGFGLSPLESGLTTVPFPVGVLLASIASGRFAGRWPRARIAGGAAALILGMVLLSFVVATVGEAVDHWRFVLPLLVSGFGMGTAISSLFQTVLANVPPQDAGSGSGATQSFQQIGAAVGIAITGQIFFASLGANLGSGMSAREAYVVSLGNALLYEIAAFALVIILLAFLKRAPAGGGGAGRTPAPVEA
ncbi:MFS transporter [Aquibium sp. ELW1220]|uniref:MFS transporter n=1 Tax=Aquibium sp. ELW1220 TaxID=2976766 RepID=UPI0025B1706E|nr:MFS transporter [Aquibium sp. ELW1220]MDN2578551.1 MFS transporter [Aquibium sp. ELW1220]